MVVILSIIAGILLIPLSWSLVDDYEAYINRQNIEVQRNELKRIIAKVSDPETLYYIQDYDIFGI
ncbi:MAG: hypothetical protein ACI4JM_04800 [Oscillospiraceae bacterium]